MDELQIWTLFSSNRIGSALTGIGIILAIWLSLRIAKATRESDEANLFTKAVSSLFGLITLAYAWQQYTIGGNIRVARVR